MLVFFFSSRRRHTRYIGDWSSDVCSSDLYDSIGGFRPPAAGRGHPHDARVCVAAAEDQVGEQRLGAAHGDGGEPLRSEERRVGKEGSSRWRKYICKKR